MHTIPRSTRAKDSTLIAAHTQVSTLPRLHTCTGMRPGMHARRGMHVEQPRVLGALSVHAQTHAWRTTALPLVRVCSKHFVSSAQLRFVCRVSCNDPKDLLQPLTIRSPITERSEGRLRYQTVIKKPLSQQRRPNGETKIKRDPKMKKNQRRNKALQEFLLFQLSLVLEKSSSCDTNELPLLPNIPQN